MRLLKQAIDDRLAFAFETTLGGSTIPRLLADAASQDIEISVWYAGLSNLELYIERVKARVRRGGHDIPEPDIRRRYERSRLNLIALLPSLTALRVYDNSADADPADGYEPSPILLLHTEERKILKVCDITRMPEWAEPIVAAALKLSES